MPHGPRLRFFAAVTGALSVVAAAVSDVVLHLPNMSAEHIAELGVAGMAAGFFFLVRKWITKQEKADRDVLDTIRALNEEYRESIHQLAEQQREFQVKVSEFMGLVCGRLGVHRADSDPGLRIEGGEEQRTIERRVIPDRRQKGLDLGSPEGQP